MLHQKWKRRVLIVDDNSINRIALRKILSEEYILLEAENGKHALEILQEDSDSISAILLDLVMPVMDGYAFLAAIQEDSKLAVIPIIVTTQKEGVENEIDALARGASDFLSKPYNPDIIRHRLANIIRLRETATFASIVERDVLTGLYTKEAFYAKVAELMAQNPQITYDILCSDVESFRLVNDIFGEREGDRLLRYIAVNLSGKVEALGGCACRLSGDTFVSILPNQSADAYRQMIEGIHKCLEIYPINLEVRMKFGVYTADPQQSQTMSVRVMCDSAKLTMESIKGKYDQTLAFYDAELGNRVKYEQEIGHEMKFALLNDQFQVYFQPKFHILTQEVIGAEALVRWQHPQRGFITPNDFIPLFERNGFITNLDYFVWDTTCKFLARWIAEGRLPFPISVNVSRVDIYNPNLAGILQDLVKRHELPSDLLHLEITETDYSVNQHQLVGMVEKLKEVGFVVEMDDFGTGYSSLNILNEMPIDILKLDTEFLRHNRSILKFVVSLAAEMQLTVIAEGVETQEDVDFLSSLGCCYGQGYFFARPLPQEKFYALLQEKTIAPFSKGESRLSHEQCKKVEVLEEHRLNSSAYDSLAMGIARFAYPGWNLMGANMPFLDAIGYFQTEVPTTPFWKLEDLLEGSEELQGILSSLGRTEQSRIYHLEETLYLGDGRKLKVPCMLQWLREEQALQIAVDLSQRMPNFIATSQNKVAIP